MRSWDYRYCIVRLELCGNRASRRPTCSTNPSGNRENSCRSRANPKTPSTWPRPPTADNGDKSGFHGVELFEKVASMPWKTAQFGFHGVENRRIRLPWRGTFCDAERNDDSTCRMARLRPRRERKAGGKAVEKTRAEARSRGGGEGGKASTSTVSPKSPPRNLVVCDGRSNGSCTWCCMFVANVSCSEIPNFCKMHIRKFILPKNFNILFDLNFLFG